jgi:hypothetical protein
MLTDPRSTSAVLVAERYADGRADDAELTPAWEAAWVADHDLCEAVRHNAHGEGDWSAATANRAAAFVAEPDPARTRKAPIRAAEAIVRAAAWLADPATREAALNEAGTIAHAKQVLLYQDILGPDPRPTVLTLRDGGVRMLALAIYEERRFGDCPILADALEEAGCANAAILEHLRGQGPHTRGCWALDLILGHR